jgi:hypothetical protein
MEIGTILCRRIGKTGFFHFGIVWKSQPLLIIEHDYDGRHLMTLEEFLYGETELWEITFDSELDKYGPAVFRSPKERVLQAIRLFKEGRPYCAETFNCEHFVRECTFSLPELWGSPQVQRLKANEVGLVSRLSMAILGIAPESCPKDAKRLKLPLKRGI